MRLDEKETTIVFDEKDKIAHFLKTSATSGNLKAKTRF